MHRTQYRLHSLRLPGGVCAWRLVCSTVLAALLTRIGAQSGLSAAHTIPWIGANVRAPWPCVIREWLHWIGVNDDTKSSVVR